MQSYCFSTLITARQHCSFEYVVPQLKQVTELAMKLCPMDTVYIEARYVCYPPPPIEMVP